MYDSSTTGATSSKNHVKINDENERKSENTAETRSSKHNNSASERGEVTTNLDLIVGDYLTKVMVSVNNFSWDT